LRLSFPLPTKASSLVSLLYYFKIFGLPPPIPPRIGFFNP